ncbi:MAG: helix-turn-helix transcriptional regulator, partial [Chloroflexota bacterium]
ALDLTYQKGDGMIVERRVEPLGLVAKGNVWYLLARSEGNIRTYRVSRVQEAATTDESFGRPSDFDVARAWERSSADFVRQLPRYPATLRVQTVVLPRLRRWRFARVDQVEPDLEGWVRVAVCFEVEEEAVEYILSLGPAVEILEPAALREVVIALLEKTRALY